MQKEIKNKFLIIPNDKDLSAYKSTSFILPLKNYSIGFEVYFDENEINELSKKYNISIIINKFLHKEDIENIKTLLLKLNNINYYFIEDFSLTSFLPKDNIVLSPIHIICNYESINYLSELGYNNVCISNELTISELECINNSTKSNIFYMYLNKNQLMYSIRELLTNYYDFYHVESRNNNINVKELTNKHELLVKEENKSTTIFNNQIFCASKYLNKLSDFNLILNFNNIDPNNKKIILDNIYNEDLSDLINSNNEFLENEIIYKVKESD